MAAPTQLEINMSPVKRERMKKREALDNKINMRAALPVLTKEEIRRCNLSPCVTQKNLRFTGTG